MHLSPFPTKDFEPAFWSIWQLHQSKNLKTILTIIPLSVPNWASAEEQFIPNYPPPDHNLGQILNSDPASSYFPLKFADLLKLKYFLHPWQPVILYYTITTIKANRDNSSYRINSLDLFCSVVLLLSCLSCYCYHYCPHKSAFQLKIAAQFSPPLPQF